MSTCTSSTSVVENSNFYLFPGPEGMEKFCEDIGVEPENVAMLVLAWKMNARRMGYFTLSEWLKGLSELQ